MGASVLVRDCFWPPAQLGVVCGLPAPASGSFRVVAAMLDDELDCEATHTECNSKPSDSAGPCLTWRSCAVVLVSGPSARAASGPLVSFGCAVLTIPLLGSLRLALCSFSLSLSGPTSSLHSLDG